MKIQVTMKDTDVLHEAIYEAINDDLKSMNLDPEEKEAIRDVRFEKYLEVASKWFTYGEYLDIEIDTEEETIRVLGANE